MSSVKGQSAGNQYALKFKTSEERKALAERFDKHCQDGLSDEAFEIDPDTLKSYITKYPEDFASIKDSKLKRRIFWERMGNAGALGKVPGFNVTAWIFNMKNRFGWRDKMELQGKDGTELSYTVRIIKEAEERNSDTISSHEGD